MRLEVIRIIEIGENERHFWCREIRDFNVLIPTVPLALGGPKCDFG